MMLLDMHERLLLWDYNTQRLMCLLFLQMANDIINTLVNNILIFQVPVKGT